MLIKPNSAACGNCGMEDHLLLHNVRYRGSFRHLCTTCVLRLHPHSFCPTCFQVYSPPPPNGAVLACFKCGSSTHPHCVSAPASPYICPLCVNPNSRIFKLKSAENDAVLMDRDAARKLLAAARIVSASLSKAAAAAKAEAERRAKEAVVTRKRAKEALEHLANLVMKEKLRGPMAVTGGFRGSNSNSNSKANAVILGAKINGAKTHSTSTVSKANAVILGAKINGAKTHSTSTVGNGGEIVEWSDSDIDQILFSDEENGSGNNLDF